MTVSGKKVLITGADGFIGSHLAEQLVLQGATVACLANYNSFGSAGWLDSLHDEIKQKLTINLGDVRDGGQMRDLVAGSDIVFHLAALIAIPYSYQAPQAFVGTNVSGTFNILEACRHNSIPKVVLTSTSEVYGTPQVTPITEDHPLQAQSPYAATKVAADQLGLAYAATYGLDVLVLRPFNTYGPRQSMRAVIPTVLAQMIAGRDEILLGSLHPRRDFTYVADTVDGFVKAALAKTEKGEVIQLGTGHAISIGELVEICRTITGSSARIIESQERIRPDASEVQVLLSDPTRALQRLEWSPQMTLEEGLKLTAAWVEESMALESVHRYYL